MNKLLGITLLVFVAAAGWQVGSRLNTDALGLALGVIFGMMAGIPAALIAVTANRQPVGQPQPQRPVRYELLSEPDYVRPVPNRPTNYPLVKKETEVSR